MCCDGKPQTEVRHVNPIRYKIEAVNFAQRNAWGSSMDALSLFGLFAVTAMLVQYALQDLATGSSCRGACALAISMMASCRARCSDWWRRSVPASRCGAGMPGGDNLAIAAQAGGEALQGAVSVGVRRERSVSTLAAPDSACGC